MTRLGLILYIALYLVSGWILPWWSPAIVGLAAGFLYASKFRHPLYQALFAASAAFIPALIFDFEASGHISLTLGGLIGLQSHVLGYLFSLCATGTLASLGSLSGTSLREALMHIRQRRVDQAWAADKQAG